MRFTSNEFSFNKKEKVLVMGGFMKSFPDFLEVESSVTGKIVKFRYDEEKAMDNEFWDGEEMHYVPTESLPNVNALVLSHMC